MDSTMNVVSIGRKDFVIGFRSIGIPGLVAENGAQAKQHINRLVGEGNTALIVLAESVGREIFPHVEEINYEKALPAVIMLEDEMSQEDLAGAVIEKSIERAIGVSLKKGR